MWLSRVVFDGLRETFERTLAVVREENATLRRMLEASDARARDLLLEITKAQAIQPTPRPEATRPIGRTPKDPIKGLENAFAPVTFEDPQASFTSARAASLMAVEDDDDGVTAAA